MRPRLQIRDRTAVIYYQADPGSGNTMQRRENMLSVRKGRYSGKMTDGSKKRMTKAITLLAMANKPKFITNTVTGRQQYHHLSFITLTVSAKTNITAREANENLLAPFLQWLRRTAKANCYIWKAEIQLRGQIHYHIITEKFIHYKDLRDAWNDLQHKAGYLDEYAKEHGHFKPNSTDIRAVQKKNNTTGYLVKSICSEMAKAVDALELEIMAQIAQDIRDGKLNFTSKNPELFDELVEMEIKDRMVKFQKLNGKTWDCSDKLAGAGYYTVDFEKHHLDAFDKLDAGKKLKILKETDFWHLIVFTGNSPPADLLTGAEQSEMDDYLQNLLN